jgi:hypothetical protein
VMEYVEQGKTEPMRHERWTMIADLPLLCRACLRVILILPWAADLEPGQIRGGADHCYPGLHGSREEASLAYLR